MAGSTKPASILLLHVAILVALDMVSSELVSPPPFPDAPKKAYQHSRQDMIVLGSTAIIETDLTSKCSKQYQGSDKFVKDMKGCLEASSTAKGAPGEPWFDMEYTQLLISKYEGENAQLNCVLRNLGDRNVIWMKTKPLPPVTISFNENLNGPPSHYSLETDNNGTFNIQIRNLKRSDEGTYECQVNTVPPMTWKVPLQIVVKASVTNILSASDGIREGRMFTFVFNESDTVQLQCVGDGSPLPSMKWIWPSGQIVENSTLRIDEINRSQAGDYRCTAENGVIGDPGVQLVTIRVNYKPTLWVTASDIRSAKGGYKVLECKVNANPRAKYTWKKDGVVLYGDNSISRPWVTKLIIVSVNPETDYGFYTCQATNIFGTTEGNISLNGKPLAPIITSNPVGYRRHVYKLTWTQPNNRKPNAAGSIPVNVYKIMYRGWWRESTKERKKVYSVQDETTLMEEAVVPDLQKVQQSCILDDLRPNATYEVQVYAVNDYGDGDTVNFTFYTALDETTAPEDGEIQGPISSSSRDSATRSESNTPAKIWQKNTASCTAPSRALVLVTLTSLVILRLRYTIFFLHGYT